MKTAMRRLRHAEAALSSARSMANLASAEAYGATDCFEQARALIEAATR